MTTTATKRAKAKPAPGPSEESVTKSTGKGWAHWFRVLDRFDVRANGHAAAARHLAEKHRLAPWWSQTVVVAYERAKGLRARLERKDGFAITVTKTIGVGPSRAFHAWADAREVGTWFTTKARQDFRVGGRYENADGDRGTYRAIRPGKRILFTWDNPAHSPGTLVEVTFAAKGRGRAVVAITHSRLKDAACARDMKKGWTWALHSLRSYLETGKPVPCV